jgi:hypothetical protein
MVPLGSPENNCQKKVPSENILVETSFPSVIFGEAYFMARISLGRFFF